MSDIRGDICDILQRVKYVKLGGDLMPLADEIIALVREAMLTQEVAEAATKAIHIAVPTTEKIVLTGNIEVNTPVVIQAALAAAGVRGGDE